MKDEKKVLTISLSPSLYNILEEEMKRAGYDDVSEFVSRVLMERFETAPDDLDNEETKILKKRLKGLGYI
jgi:metal-responsive CopG/Arc/MetJ family transcriptional regulator